MATIEIAQITPVIYGEYGLSCEPSHQGIAEAVAEKKLETRRYQEDLELLKSEWGKAKSVEEHCKLVKQYHTCRVAFFVVNKWKDPILLDHDQRTIIDGLHRLKAAQYLGMKTIEADIKPVTPPG